MYTHKEKIKFLKRWVKALRSGKYKQGRGYLCELNEDHVPGDGHKYQYCCLGVAAKISKYKNADLLSKAWLSMFDKDLAQLVEIHENEYPVSETVIESDYATFNDEDSLDFNEIADIVEAHIEEMETVPA